MLKDSQSEIQSVLYNIDTILIIDKYGQIQRISTWFYDDIISTDNFMTKKGVKITMTQSWAISLGHLLQFFKLGAQKWCFTWG